MTILIRFAMAEGVVNGNGSFQNQTEDVASTSSSTRSAARKVTRHQPTQCSINVMPELLRPYLKGRAFNQLSFPAL